MIILGIDPGGTTGLLTWWSAKDEYFFEQIITRADSTLSLSLAAYPDYWHFYTYLVRAKDKADRHGEKFIIVCERFNFRLEERDRTKIDYTSAELIGIIKLFCTQYNVQLELQMAAEGKGFWDNDKIKQIGLWKPAQRHAMDALRHVLHYRAFDLNDQELLLKLRTNDVLTGEIKPKDPTSERLGRFYKKQVEDKYHID